MITLRRSEERRHLRRGTSDTWMTFDPENPIDPLRRGFHALESLNEERLGPEMGLQSLGQEDLEIITYVHEGNLIHQDESGGLGRLGPGEFQRTRVSQDLRHRALNGSALQAAHVFQSAITAKARAARPLQEQKRFPQADREGILRIVVSPDGAKASLPILQDVRMYSSILLLGHHLIHELAAGRGAWIHVVKGRIRLGDLDLRAGDGAALENVASLSFTAQAAAEILLFDLA
jgi:redox-sensitive bicupin YhaK (pirin superfamily)